MADRNIVPNIDLARQGVALISRLSALVLFAAVVLIAWSIVLGPTLETAIVRHQRIEDLTRELEHRTAIYNRVTALKTERAALERAVPSSVIGAPDSPSISVPNLQNIVQSAVSFPGVSLNRITSNPKAGIVAIEIGANLKTFATVLQRIETNPVPMTITALDIKQKKETDTALIINLTINSVGGGTS